MTRKVKIGVSLSQFALQQLEFSCKDFEQALQYAKYKLLKLTVYLA